MFIEFPLKVVAIDDDRFMLELYKLHAENCPDVSYYGFTNAKEAMEFIKDTPNVHLAIVDINLEEVKGDKLLRDIMELRKGIDVVMVTGDKQFLNLHSCFRAGARDYLVKPIKKNHFMPVLNRIIENRKRWSEVLKDIIKKD